MMRTCRRPHRLTVRTKASQALNRSSILREVTEPYKVNMTKNPFLNALLASGYISLVASAMYYSPKYAGSVDAVIVPVAMLSLFVLSSVMIAFLFFYQPIQLYLDGAKKESVSLILRTAVIFAAITGFLIFVLIVSSRISS